MSEGSTDLVPANQPEDQPQLFKHFLLPLVRGQKVSIGVPLNRSHLEEVLSAVITGDRSIQNLQLRLQRMASRLVAHPVMIELTVDDLKLAAAAYQVCWFFHEAPESERIWQRRVENIVKETETLLEGVGLPRTEGQLIARHLMLRHLTRLYRVDTRVEFGVFWGALEFVGTEPTWVKMPGRARGVMERSTVWVHKAVYSKPVSRAFWRLMSLTPLTSLMACDRLDPYFTFWGTATALAMPSTCRLVTNHTLNEGLGNFMPALGRAFVQYIKDSQQPLSHRRYVGRFLYNLVLTHCTFADQASLEGRLVPTASLDGPVEGEKAPAPKAAPEGGGSALDPLEFYASAWALHQLRGPLGAAHLLAEEGLGAKVERFLAAGEVEPRQLNDMFGLVSQGLQYRSQGV